MAILDGFAPVADDDQLNDGWFNAIASTPIRLNILNCIRELQDRTVNFSNGNQDCFADAYVSIGGRMGSVKTSKCNFISCTQFNVSDTSFSSNNITDTISSDTDHNARTYGSWNNSSYAFDGNEDTYAYYAKTSGTTSDSIALGKTFGAKTIKYISLKARMTNTSASTGSYHNIYLQTYNGSTWSTIKVYMHYSPGSNFNLDSGIFSDLVYLNSSIQGVRLYADYVTTSTSTPVYLYIYKLEASTTDSIGESIIYHKFNPSKYPNNVSSAITTSMIKKYETGADLQFKLKSYTADGVDDTETISANTVNTTQYSKKGLYLNLNVDMCFLKSVTKHSSCTANTCYVYENYNSTTGDGNLIATATFSGNVATFSSLVPLFNNVAIMCDTPGGSYTETYTSTYANNTNTQVLTWDGTYIWNIDSIVVQTGTVDDDSGYISYGNNPLISSFGTFSSSPSMLEIKIIPKSSSPTIKCPAITGTGAYFA